MSVILKARRVIIDPTTAWSGYPIAVVQADPADPNVTADDLKVRIVGDDWVIPLPHHRLEEVTEDDVRREMKLPPSKVLLITPPRTLPDYAWISHEMLDWMQAWHREAVTEWENARLAPAS